MRAGDMALLDCPFTGMLYDKVGDKEASLETFCKVVQVHGDTATIELATGFEDGEITHDTDIVDTARLRAILGDEATNAFETVAFNVKEIAAAITAPPARVVDELAKACAHGHSVQVKGAISELKTYELAKYITSGRRAAAAATAALASGDTSYIDERVRFCYEQKDESKVVADGTITGVDPRASNTQEDMWRVELDLGVEANISHGVLVQAMDDWNVKRDAEHMVPNVVIGAPASSDSDGSESGGSRAARAWSELEDCRALGCGWQRRSKQRANGLIDHEYISPDGTKHRSYKQAKKQAREKARRSMPSLSTDAVDIDDDSQSDDGPAAKRQRAEAEDDDEDEVVILDGILVVQAEQSSDADIQAAETGEEDAGMYDDAPRSTICKRQRDASPASSSLSAPPPRKKLLELAKQEDEDEEEVIEVSSDEE